jgi:aminoglycoside/choline kinase family phosphotransferase
MSDRSTQLKRWLEQLGYQDYRLSPASEDASFRSYWRLESGDQSVIVMDAPPQKESCDSFIDVAARLRFAKLMAPEVIAQNPKQGFLILTDFGNDSYLSQLDDDSAGSLYADALSALLTMQTQVESDSLPSYDEALLSREMDLFHDWFLGRLLRIELNQEQQSLWQDSKRSLIASALAQPRTFVHRDYHSRNLMKLDHNNPGILDFQDAVKGPVTYDLVSLLRDCYISWPRDTVEQLALDFHRSARSSHLQDVTSGQFMTWFNLMGIQRHLKAVGIFSRLNIRDGKPGYMKDIPRTLSYIRQVSATEASMEGLLSLITELDLEARAVSLAEE